MTYNFDGYNYVIKLQRGEQLSAALHTFVEETRITGAWVSGLGAAREMTLGYYHLDKQEYQWRQFTEGPYEIAGLTGNIAFDEQGKMVFHLHGTFGDRQYQSISGHLKDLTAAATVELFVHRTYKPLKRTHDPAVGLATLDL